MIRMYALYDTRSLALNSGTFICQGYWAFPVRWFRRWAHVAQFRFDRLVEGLGFRGVYFSGVSVLQGNICGGSLVYIWVEGHRGADKVCQAS